MMSQKEPYSISSIIHIKFHPSFEVMRTENFMVLGERKWKKVDMEAKQAFERVDEEDENCAQSSLPEYAFRRENEDGQVEFSSWIELRKWKLLPLYQKIIRRFQFSCTHLNLDQITWNKLSDEEKLDFSLRKKRWVNQFKKKADEKEMKKLRFWQSRYRVKGQIFSIRRFSAKGSSNSLESDNEQNFA